MSKAISANSAPEDGLFDTNITDQWDEVSKAENPKFNPIEKQENSQLSPEEYKQLADKELLLRGTVYDAMTSRVKGASDAILNIEDTIQEDSQLNSSRLLESLDYVANGEKSTSINEADALVYYIDALYPSQFGNQISNDANAREADYFECAAKKDTSIIDGLDGLALTIREDEALNATGVANGVTELSNKASGKNAEIAKTMIGYLREPNEDSRHELAKAIDTYNASIGDGVKEVGSGLSKVSTSVGDSVDGLRFKTAEGVNDYYSAVLDYIDFKLQYAKTPQTQDSASSSNSNLAGLFK